MRVLTPLLAAVTLVAVAPHLSAQRFALDLRGAVAAPTAKLAGTELETGFGFGATLAYRIQPHLNVYGGWDWMHFNANQSFAGSDMDFEETGYTFGLRFEHPFRSGTGLAYRLEGGGTYKHNEMENTAGDLVANTGHGLGYEAGAGLVVPFNASWRFAPTLRYRALSRDYTVSGSTREGELKYLAFEFGVARHF